MLTGIRKKIIQKYKKEKEQLRNENIQYSSSQKFTNVQFLDKKLNKNYDKDQSFIKNKFKYEDLKSKQIGKYQPGILTFSKQEIERIQKS